MRWDTIPNPTKVWLPSKVRVPNRRLERTGSARCTVRGRKTAELTATAQNPAISGETGTRDGPICFGGRGGGKTGGTFIHRTGGTHCASLG